VGAMLSSKDEVVAGGAIEKSRYRSSNDARSVDARDWAVVMR